MLSFLCQPVFCQILPYFPGKNSVFLGNFPFVHRNVILRGIIMFVPKRLQFLLRTFWPSLSFRSQKLAKNILNSTGLRMLEHGGTSFGVKTLRDPKVVESCRKFEKVLFSSRNVVKTWYNFNFLELSILMCFRRVFTPTSLLSPSCAFSSTSTFLPRLVFIFFQTFAFWF